jgi:hypothetical protein
LIAGWINRRTLDKLETRRGTREAVLDEQRASREAARDAHRAERELTIERRRAFGAARVLERELTHRALLIERLSGTFAEVDARQAFAIDLQSESATLLATWLTDAMWARLSEVVAYLQHIEWDRMAGTIAFEPMSGTGSTYADTHNALMDTLSTLEIEIEERAQLRSRVSDKVVGATGLRGRGAAASWR